MADTFSPPPTSTATPSGTPHPENSNGSSNMQRPTSKKQRKPPHDRVRNNERSGARSYINKFLTSEKSHQMLSQDLERALEGKFADYLDYREQKELETVRVGYKEYYDPEDDKRWLRRNSATVLNAPTAGRGDEDMDNEEPAISSPKRGIKREGSVEGGSTFAPPRGIKRQRQKQKQKAKPKRESEIMDYFHNTSLFSRTNAGLRDTKRPNYTESSDEENDDDEDHKTFSQPSAKSNFVAAVACSRGFTARNSDFVPKGLEKVKTAEDLGVEVVVRLAPRLEGATRRSWQWVNGEMVVWPPFGVALAGEV